MKICQVTHRYPPNTGGIETHVREVSERLAEHGHEVTVVTADASADVQGVAHRNGVEIRRHRSLSPDGAFHVAPAIARAVRQVDADVIHAHNYHSLAPLFAAAGVQNERFVVTPHYHGGSPDALRDRLLSLYRPLGRRLLHRADAVVAVSEWERERLRSDFGIEATLVPNGIERERFATADAEARDRPYLLCAGRLEEYKGVQHAIRALPSLPEWELVVAGSGSYRSDLASIAERSDVADRVTLLGYVDDDRLPGLYVGADVFLALSDFEAYGMTVAEALASGTPCVVHAAGALTDWTTNDGCVDVTDRSPERIAEAVRKVRDRTPDVDALWSWGDVTTALLDVYRRE